jgi:hypothetical protein
MIDFFGREIWSIILGSADSKSIFLVIAGAGALRQANQGCLDSFVSGNHLRSGLPLCTYGSRGSSVVAPELADLLLGGAQDDPLVLLAEHVLHPVAGGCISKGGAGGGGSAGGSSRSIVPSGGGWERTKTESTKQRAGGHCGHSVSFDSS